MSDDRREPHSSSASSTSGVTASAAAFSPASTTAETSPSSSDSSTIAAASTTAAAVFTGRRPHVHFLFARTASGSSWSLRSRRIAAPAPTSASRTNHLLNAPAALPSSPSSSPRPSFRRIASCSDASISFQSFARLLVISASSTLTSRTVRSSPGDHIGDAAPGDPLLRNSSSMTASTAGVSSSAFASPFSSSSSSAMSGTYSGDSGRGVDSYSYSSSSVEA
mmetsp:Transcript_1193/g.4673  ORF Transcript_1193/g.4673 Transcript_1193/m.4673 type:complete len:222 (+) Transcript_1193:55-720(+)